MKTIWVVDRQNHWRQLAVRALQEGGFCVKAFDGYESVPFKGPQGQEPDLVLLSCAVVGPEEKLLLDRMTGQGRRVLVLASSLPLRQMPTLFRAGVTDVAKRRYNEPSFLTLAQGTLNAAMR